MTLNMSMYGVQVSAVANGRISLTIGNASASLSPQEFAVLLDLFGGVADLARRASEAHLSLAGAVAVEAPAAVISRQAEVQPVPVQAPAPAARPAVAAEPAPVPVPAPTPAPTPARAEAKAPVQAPEAPAPLVQAAPAKAPQAKVSPAKPAAPAVVKPGRPRAIAQPETLAAFVAARAAADASLTAVDRSKPGRPRAGYVPGTAPISVAPGKDVSSGKPGRPRVDGLGKELAGIGLNRVKPVELDAKGKTKPGRARLDGASPEAIAAASAARPSLAVKAGRGRKPAPLIEKRKPGRPRKNPPVEAVRTSGARLIDLVDQWMTESPGAKSFEQILAAAQKGRWLADPSTAEQQIKTTIPRHRDMFVLTAEGKYQRRAEIEQATVAGKIVRRRPSSTKTAG